MSQRCVPVWGDAQIIPFTRHEGGRIVSATIAENLAALRQHIRALEERAEAAEGKLDIIRRRLEGEPDDSLAVDYGGTGWENDPAVRAVSILQDVNLVVRQMYFIRLRKYAQLEALMGLVTMCRVQIGEQLTEE